MDAIGRICPVVSDLSGFKRKLVRWCRICLVVSDWYVGFSVGFSEVLLPHPFALYFRYAEMAEFLAAAQSDCPASI